ncbi:MAG: HEAT repeat domain-containing protein [Myxococcota bacterium]
MRALWTVVGSLALAFSLDASAAPDPVLTAIASDPSFKVRMQAIRVLTKRLVAEKRPAAEGSLAALARAATADENYLVRGLACYSLGQLGDPRGRTPLLAGKGDPHPFVREQAEEALRQLPTAAPEPGTEPTALPLPGREGQVPVAIAPERNGPASQGISVVTEGQALGTDALDRAKSVVLDRLKERVTQGWTLESTPTHPGYQVALAIADRKVEPTEGSKTRVTLVVRATISSWPENHLRHVVTARATAETAAQGDSARTRLEQRVLEAAAKQAADETITELSRD